MSAPIARTAPASAAILAFPEATASVIYGLSDLFHSAGRDWGMIVTGIPGAPLIRPRIVAAEAGPFRIANDVTVVPDARLSEVPDPDLICVPEILVSPSEPLTGRFEREIEWLRACYARGSTVAAACSGSLLLAEAGLLDGEAATSHWAYCDALAERFPAISVQRQRSLVAAGEGQRLIMAGGGSSLAGSGPVPDRPDCRRRRGDAGGPDLSDRLASRRPAAIRQAFGEPSDRRRGGREMPGLGGNALQRAGAGRRDGPVQRACPSVR
jgi:putative intracellular protease/amidase